MSSQCLKCKTDTESKNLRVKKLGIKEQCFCQNVQCAIVKIQDLLDSKKEVGY